MKPPKLLKFAITGLAFAVTLAGCGSSGNNLGGSGGSSSGSGGSGSGGTSAGGGTTGSGGSAGGGTTGSGGSASGGTTGSGGSSNGGTTGSGGSASGGTTGSGGSSSGGASGHGGGSPSGGNGGSATGGNGGGGRGGSGGAGGSSGAAGGSSGAFILTSPDQADGAKFGMMFTCAAMNGTFGSGVNPELDWSAVPASTASFAITFIDTALGETSPMGQHWAMWDVPAAARTFPKGTTMLTGDLAGAKQTNKYLAPCPSGNDTYELTIYALPTATLTVSGAEGSGVSNSAGVAKVLAALKTVTPLGTAKLHGTSGPMGK